MGLGMEQAGNLDGTSPVQCADCSTHFQTGPGDMTGAEACPECGGNRLFRLQPVPVQSEGTLRNMVDSDSQKDMGGNPLGEGMIVGDGSGTGHEKPIGKRDNYMHGHVAGLDMGGIADGIMREKDRPCPKCGSPMHFRNAGSLTPMHPNGAWECSNQRCWNMIPGDERQQSDPNPVDPWMDNEPGTMTFPQQWTSSVPQRVMSRSLNMEPYHFLWSDEMMKTAGAIPEAAMALSEGAGAAAEGGAAAGAGFGGSAKKLMQGAMMGHSLSGGGNQGQPPPAQAGSSHRLRRSQSTPSARPSCR